MVSFEFNARTWKQGGGAGAETVPLRKFLKNLLIKMQQKPK
jgi:hypothetical protein